MLLSFVVMFRLALCQPSEPSCQLNINKRMCTTPVPVEGKMYNYHMFLDIEGKIKIIYHSKEKPFADLSCSKSSQTYTCKFFCHKSNKTKNITAKTDSHFDMLLTNDTLQVNNVECDFQGLNEKSEDRRWALRTQDKRDVVYLEYRSSPEGKDTASQNRPTKGVLLFLVALGLGRFTTFFLF